MYSNRLKKAATAQTKRTVQQLDYDNSRALFHAFNTLHRIKFVRSMSTPLYKKIVGPHPRTAAGSLCLLLIISIVTPVTLNFYQNQRYELNSYAHTLLGSSNQNLSKKLTYNSKDRLFQFNKDAKKDPTTEGNPLQGLQTKVGGEGKEDEQQYSVDVSEDLSKGIAYYDNQMELSFKLVPQFTTMPGQKRDGHLIYPLTGGANGQVAYTVGAAGMKENVLLYKSPGDTFKMSYKLELPKSLEARLIPETGDLGIYSADPTLFGNISYGSSDDQTRVENARVNGAKTFLTFKIPAPIVMGLNGTDQSTVAPVHSHFEYRNNMLTVQTTGLDKAEYPLAIDPSVNVDTTSDFQSGNLEDNNADVVNGSLKRGTLSGGSVGSWSNATDMSEQKSGHQTVAYNGYLYVTGGAPLNAGPATFNYTGASQTYTVPAGVTSIAIDARGAEGGPTTDGTNVAGGKGGRVQTTMAVTPGEVLTIYVGGQGKTAYSAADTSGYNGGGNGGKFFVAGAGGGGGSDVRQGGTALTSRKVVAGGGGGGGVTGDGISSTLGGNSGGLSGLSGQNNAYCNGGGGGTQTAGGSGRSSSSTGFDPVGYAGSLGQGGQGSAYDEQVYGGGGGGGYYGGAGGGSNYGGTGAHACGGGGGSSYAGTGTANTTHTSGFQSGNGSITVNPIIGASSNNTVRYAKINADGTLGSWQNSPNTFNARTEHSSVVYNGRLYLIGGTNGTNSFLNDVQYAQINANGSLGAWNTTTSFSTARHLHRSVVYNGYLYILGGVNSSYLTDVQYAPINANGTLGAWSSTTNLPSARSSQAAVVYNGYIYILGGIASQGGVLADVQYAPVNSNGTIGAWTATTSFSSGRFLHTATVYKGYLYVMGGIDLGGNPYNDVQYAPINANGTIGSWNTTTTLVGRYFLTSVIYNGYMYASGGIDSNGGTRSDVQYAKIDPPGVTSNYTAATSMPGTQRHFHATVAYNNYLYIIGGYSASYSGYTNTTFYAPVSANGAVGSWTQGGNLPAALQQLSVVAHNGYIYAMGGVASNGSVTNAVYSANIVNGSLSGWTTVNNMATPRMAHATVMYNNYLYAIGGQNTSSAGSSLGSIEKAFINGDGTLGAWSASSSLSTGSLRGNLAAAVNGNKLYVFGGTNQSGTYLNTVQYASFNGSGDIAASAWSNGTVLPTARAYTATVIYNGYIYVTGGQNGSTFYNDVYVAPINSDGAIGLWSNTVALSTTVAYHTASVMNGRLYITGGFNGSYFNTVRYAQINNGSPGSMGAISTLTSFSNARYNHKMLAYNGYMYIVGGANSPNGFNTIYYGDIQYAKINANGTLGVWAATTGMPTARNGAGVMIANGYMYALGGSTYQYDPVSGTTSATSYNDVQYAKVNADGTIGAWAVTTSFTGTRYGQATTTYNGYAYILGGTNATGSASTGYADAQYAKINANGTLGAWSTLSATGNNGGTAFVYNGYMYNIGAAYIFDAPPIAVQYAPVNANGTLGTWTTLAGTSWAGMVSIEPIAYNGYLYLGTSSGYFNGLEVMYRAAINSDGSLGSWQQDPRLLGAQQGYGRSGSAATIYNGYYYNSGGYYGLFSPTYYNDVAMAPLNTMSRKAQYSKLIDIGTGSSLRKMTFSGSLPGGIDSLQYRITDQNGAFGPLTKGTLSTCTTGNAGRYIQVYATMDDTYNAAYRDEINQNAYLDSITLDLALRSAPPDKRLRHGSYFAAEQLLPFDTNNTQCI